MATVENIRNNIIEKLLAITNKEYLTALDKLIEKNNIENDMVQLNDFQIQMLELSEQDIKEGCLFTQEQVDKEDREWLKEQ